MIVHLLVNDSKLAIINAQNENHKMVLCIIQYCNNIYIYIHIHTYNFDLPWIIMYI